MSGPKLFEEIARTSCQIRFFWFCKKICSVLRFFCSEVGVRTYELDSEAGDAIQTYRHLLYKKWSFLVIWSQNIAKIGLTLCHLRKTHRGMVENGLTIQGNRILLMRFKKKFIKKFAKFLVEKNLQSLKIFRFFQKIFENFRKFRKFRVKNFDF